MKTLLIDGDSLIYKAGFSTEYTVHTLAKDGDIVETKYKKESKQLQDDGYELVSSVKTIEPVENALHIAKNSMNDIIDEAGCNNTILFLSAPGKSFRHEIYPMYKANRTAPKPQHYYKLYEYLSTRWAAQDKPGFEADDLVSIRAHELLADGQDYVIAHIDKDLDMIPGEHFNYNTYTYYEVNPIDAEFNFYCQLLSGDYSDNVPGLAKVGKITAEKLLADTNQPEDMWDTVLEIYKDRDPEVTEEEIINRARLLRLLESEDYIWTPPK